MEGRDDNPRHLKTNAYTIISDIAFRNAHMNYLLSAFVY